MDRTLSMCRAYITERVSFGRPLMQHQAIQKMIADGATAIHSGNLMTLHIARNFSNQVENLRHEPIRRWLRITSPVHSAKS